MSHAYRFSLFISPNETRNTTNVFLFVPVPFIVARYENGNKVDDTVNQIPFIKRKKKTKNEWRCDPFMDDNFVLLRTIASLS